MIFQTPDGREIYYEIHEKNGVLGTIVLLHHGFGCTKIWKNIYPGFVEEGYKIIMFDRRGYGQSEPGENFSQFYMSDKFRPDSVNDMSHLIDFLGVRSFHIIGQCEGGVIGIDYAVRYPDQVETIITSSTQCFSSMTMVEKNKNDFKESFMELKPALKEKLRQWHGENAQPFFEMFKYGGGAYGTGYFDLRPTLKKVLCPSLVIYPDRSSIFDVEQGVSFYKHLERGELAVLPSCGHNTYEYLPADYVRISLEFLKRHNPKIKPLKQTDILQGLSCLAVREKEEG